jgi:biotin operon repressor
MSEYLSIKILATTIEKLVKKLRKKGIKVRSNAEAVNVLINNFLLEEEGQ